MRTPSFDLDGRSPRRESNLALLSLWNSIVLFKAKPQMLNRVHFIESFFFVVMWQDCIQLLSNYYLDRLLVWRGCWKESQPLPPPSLSPFSTSTPLSSSLLPLLLFTPLLPYFFPLRVLLFSGGLSTCIPFSSGALALELCIPLIL